MGKPSGGAAPDYEKLMRLGFELQKEFAPKYARQEYQLRQKFDPKLIKEQQGLQARFGPTQYAQQLQALERLDPQRAAAYKQAAALAARDQARGYIDPRQEALYNLAATQTRGELARGRGMSPEMLRETQQALRAGQSARGNIYGNAPLSAEALYSGQRGQQLYQQRLQNALGVYGQQTGREKAQAQAGGVYGSGGYQSPISLVSGIQGVQAPRGFGYVNPAAGQQAAQFGLANYPNQMANQGQNPWASALGGAAAGAQAGTMISPGYGTAIGAVVGGLGGYLGSG
jgi:hypothetical protein